MQDDFSENSSNKNVKFNKIIINNEPEKLNINKFNKNEDDKSNNTKNINNLKIERLSSNKGDISQSISIDVQNKEENIPSEKRINPIESEKEIENHNQPVTRDNINSQLMILLRSIRNLSRSSLSNSNMDHNKKKVIEYCVVCEEKLTEEEKKDNNLIGCKHICCNDCYYEFLKEKINSNFIEAIKCPQKYCESKLHDDLIEKILYRDIPLLDKYKKLQMKRQLMLNPNIQLCPFPDCDSYAKKENDNKYVSCIKNKHKFCFICLKDWHGNKKCDDKVDKSFEKWRDSYKVKRCPKCKFFIEKNEGCNHITCCNCKYQFCWLCMGEYKDEHYTLGRCSGLQNAECSICSNRLINFCYQFLMVILKCVAFAIVFPFVIIIFIYYTIYEKLYDNYDSCIKFFFCISGALSCFNFAMCLMSITSIISVLMIFIWPLQDKILSLMDL